MAKEKTRNAVKAKGGAVDGAGPKKTAEPASAESLQAVVRTADIEPAVEMVNVRRRQGRAAKTRQKILEAGLTEFASMGFEGASTRSIAERADVPHGLVIYHFETKLGVWQAVIERAFVDLHESFAQTVQALEGAGAETILRAGYRNFIKVLAERPELTWLFQHEGNGSDERLHWLLQQIRGRDVEFSLELIRELQAAGRFIDGDPAHLHLLYVGAASHIFGLKPEVEHYMGTTPFEPSFIDQHIALCESLFFRQPTAEREPSPVTKAKSRKVGDAKSSTGRSRSTRTNKA